MRIALALVLAAGLRPAFAEPPVIHDDFRLPSVEAVDGERTFYRLSDLRGHKALLIDFASW